MSIDFTIEFLVFIIVSFKLFDILFLSLITSFDVTKIGTMGACYKLLYVFLRKLYGQRGIFWTKRGYRFGFLSKAG